MQRGTAPFPSKKKDTKKGKRIPLEMRQRKLLCLSLKKDSILEGQTQGHLYLVVKKHRREKEVTGKKTPQKKKTPDTKKKENKKHPPKRDPETAKIMRAPC